VRVVDHVRRGGGNQGECAERRKLGRGLDEEFLRTTNGER
jgi:hypothetical protein